MGDKQLEDILKQNDETYRIANEALNIIKEKEQNSFKKFIAILISLTIIVCVFWLAVMFSEPDNIENMQTNQNINQERGVCGNVQEN